MPASISVEGDTTYGARREFTKPTATDVVDGDVPVTCTHASGTLFLVGPTTVTCSATNTAGLTATGTFTVTVTDKAAPTLAGVPQSFTVEGSPTDGATVTYDLPTAADTVDPFPLVVCSTRSGSTLPVGKHTVTCTATDASNNKSAAGSFTITVIETGSVALSTLSVTAGAGATAVNALTTSSVTPSAKIDAISLTVAAFNDGATITISSEDGNGQAVVDSATGLPATPVTLTGSGTASRVLVNAQGQTKIKVVVSLGTVQRSHSFVVNTAPVRCDADQYRLVTGRCVPVTTCKA